MAQKIADYTIGFNADTTQLKQQVKEVQTLLKDISSFKFSSANNGSAFTQEMVKAASAAKDLQMKMEAATNLKTGKLDLTKFNQSLKQSGITLEQYATRLSAIGPEGTKAFIQVANAISQASLPALKLNGIMNDMWITMKNTMKWQLTSSMVHGFMSALSTSYGYAKDLNESLTNIRIVSGQSADQMERFARQANEAAKQLSTTTVKYTDAALIYYQQGLPDEQVIDRTNATIKMANVTGDAVADVSSQLTAIWNNFDNGTKSLEYYADVITALGAATASSSSEIANGLEKFASIADVIGLSYEYATSALATIVAKTRQSEDTVGTALKTIFARIQGLSLGETLEDGTDLNKYSKALQTVGIEIKDASGEMKAMDVILDELGEKWKTLGKDEQMALAQTVAGVRQYTQLVSLMDNYDFFKDNVAIATGAEGTLQEQADIYAESWEAASKRVRAAAEQIYAAIFDDKVFIGLTNAVGKIIETFGDLIDGVGGLAGVLPIVGAMITKFFGSQLTSSLRSTKDMFLALSGAQEREAVELKKRAANIALAQDMENKGLEIEARRIEMQSLLYEKIKEIGVERARELENEMEFVQIFAQQTQEMKEQARISQQASNDIKTQMLGKTEAIGMVGSKKTKAKRQTFSTQGSEIIDSIQTKSKDLGRLKALIESQEKYTKKITETQVEMNKLSAENKTASEKYKQLAASLEKTKHNLNLVQTEIGENGRTKVELLIQEIDKLQKEFVKLAEAGKVSSEEIKNFLADLAILKETAQNSGAQEVSGEIAENMSDFELDEIEEKIRNATKASMDWADAVVEVGGALMDISMIVNGVSQLFDIWSDEDLSLTEKLTESIGALSMVLFSYAAIAKTLAPILTTVVTVTHAETDELISNAVANKSNIVGKLSAAAAEKLFGDSALATTKILMGQMIVLTGFVAAVVGAVKLIDYLIVTQKEAQEKVANASKAYEEQKEKLDELNNKLKETTDRIDELNKQPTLTIIEEEELDKLKIVEKSLRNQLKTQQELTKNKAKDFSSSLKNNFSNAYGLGKKGEQKDAQALYGSMSQEAITANWLTGLMGGKQFDFTKQAENAREKFIEENRESFTQAEEDYANYLQMVEEGLVTLDEDLLGIMQATLAENRKYLVGEAEYYQEYVQSVLDDEDFSQINDKIISAIKSGNLNLAKALIGSDKEFKKYLQSLGISIDDFLNTLSNRIEEKKKEINNLVGGKEFLKSLSNKDLKILMDIDINKFGDVERLKEFLDNYKNNTINVEVQQQGDSIEKINDFQSPLENAFSQYQKNKGFLTTDEAEALLEKNEQYAKYLKYEGDQIVFTQQALEDLKESENQEQELLKQRIELIQNSGKVNTEYVSELIQSYDDISVSARTHKQEIESHSEGLVSELTKVNNKIKELSETYQEDQNTENYLSGLADQVRNLSSAFEELGDIDLTEQFGWTDDLEAEFSQLTGSIAGGIQDVYKQYENFQGVNIDDQLRSVSSSLRSLDTMLAKVNSHKVEIIDIDGINDRYKAIKLTEDELKNLSEEEQRAEIASREATAEMLNQNKTIIDQAEALAPTAELFEKYYDITQMVADEAGQFIDGGLTDIEFNIIVNSESWDGFKNDLYTDLERLQVEAPGTFQMIAESAIASAKDQRNAESITLDELHGLITNNADALEGYYQAVDGDITSASSTLAEAVGKVIKALGQAIDNFNYSLKLTATKATNIGPIAIGKWLLGEGAPPELELKISSINNGTSGLGASLQNLGAFVSNMQSSRSGASKYGGTPPPSNSSTLNPDDIGGGSGGSKKKKGGGSGKDETPEQKELEEISDRYEVINRQIEKQNKLLDENEKVIERTYGKTRFGLYDKELKELDKLEAKYLEKEKLARGYLKGTLKGLDEVGDINRLNNAFSSLGIKASIDNNLNILDNYQEMQKAAYDEYNKVVEKYNAAGSASAQKNLKQELENAKTLFDTRIGYLKQLQETLDTIQESAEKAAEIARKKFDEKLEKLNYQFQLVLDVKEAKKDVRDFSREIIESFSDELYHGVKSLENQYDGALENMNFFGDLEGRQNDLLELLRSNDDAKNTQAIIEELGNLRGEIISTGEELLDFLDNLENAFPDALSALNDRFDKFIDSLKHNTTILQTINELLNLQGISTTVGKGYDAYMRSAQGQINSAVGQAKMQKLDYDRAMADLARAEATLARYQEGDAAYDIAYNNWVALKEETEKAQEAWLDAAKEALELAKDKYVKELEHISEEFDKKLSNMASTVNLQQAYDNYIDLEDDFLDPVNRLYETTALNRKVQNALDAASDNYQKQILRDLQSEFELRQSATKLSEYDIQVMEAKYNMTLKQIALEEAQNNKNKATLFRNAQGNWSYRYTVDDDAVSNAQQEFDDAANEYYNLAKNRVKDMSNEIVQLKAEMSEKIREIYEDEEISEQEREEQISIWTNFYQTKIEDCYNQIKLAAEDMNDAASLSMDDYYNTYYNDIMAMIDTNETFKDDFNQMIEDMKDAQNSYRENTEEVIEETGTDYEHLSDMIDDTNESTEELVDVGLDATDMMWDMADAVFELTEKYMDEAEAIMEVVRALEELARANASAVEEAANKDYTKRKNNYGDLAAGLISEQQYLEGAQVKGASLDQATSTLKNYTQLIAQIPSDMINSMQKEWASHRTEDGDYDASFNTWIKEWIKNNVASLDTGGYTGDFTNSGRLAILHEKELVLNRSDSENILNAVNGVRLLEPALLKMISGVLNTPVTIADRLTASYGIGSFDNEQGFQQQVYVSASFPNAIDQNEIQTAILGLANYASQYVNKR